MSNGFIIDTHLLRELGDLLVGRDSTAVLELVKNGYDADASMVRIHAENLRDPELARLTVEDDGTGMTLERFQSAFLRIAGREKETGRRKSTVFGRSYTGQKGIGRLASQKLANRLSVSSVPATSEGEPPREGVHAEIDWEAIDKQDQLNDLVEGLRVEGVDARSQVPSGTTLALSGLKRSWREADIATFVNELNSSQPASYVTASSMRDLSLADESLLGRPKVRGSSPGDPGFSLRLTGDLDVGDDLWPIASKNFDWCVELEVASGRARYRVTPTRRLVDSEPLARTYNFESNAPEDLSFQTRFFVMPGAQSRGPLSGFTRAQSGIRIYLEGFRVLPYGEYRDDWLDIDRDYRGGPRYYSIDVDPLASDEIEVDTKEALNALGSNSYYGAVFLTTEGAPFLESLINREGFVPSASFTAIQSLVRNAVRLSVRVRRSVHNQREALASRPDALPRAHAETDHAGEEDSGRGIASSAPDTPDARQPYGLLSHRSTPADAQRKIDEAHQIAARIAAQLASGQTSFQASNDGGSDEVQALADGFEIARANLRAVESIQPELRTLAGVGLQLGAFVHDINGMLATATTIRQLISAVIAETQNSAHRRELQSIARAADELAHVLARQSSYLTDVLSTDPRRRRSRVSVLDRVQSVLRFLAQRIDDKELVIHTSIPNEIRTPPMFPAELMILATNLLTNAVKNSPSKGSVWVDAVEDDSTNLELRVENDGNAVRLDEAERWFLPFESTTTEVDEVLGQGLGLGLPISRAITDDYNGTIRFVEPMHGGATAIQVVLPKKGASR